MKLIFLGTGGAIPTPRLFGECNLCNKAREKGIPYKRNSSSLYIDKINGIIDCPEDISDSINSKNIFNIKTLFITHWHPDHTFGLRLLLEANYDFINRKALKKIDIYISKNVYMDLRRHYPNIDYMENEEKMCNIKFIEHNESVEINGVRVTAIGYKGINSCIYGYLLEEKNKKILYTPCDTIEYEQEIYNLDYMITECGMFSKEIKSEIQFDDLINKIRKFKCKKVFLTHIEEIELSKFGYEYLNKVSSEYSDVDLTFAYDGLVLDI